MHYKFIKIATKIIESYYSHTHGRHNKEPIEHYLKTIFKVLKTGMQWSRGVIRLSRIDRVTNTFTLYNV